MISVDISNIWCSVSLPDLLQSEKTIFDAHMKLSGEQRQNSWLSWLDPSDTARRQWVNPIVAAVEKIRMNSEILVVVGGGLSAAAAQAAIRLLPGRTSTLRLLFLGEDYSTEKWLHAVQTLENAEFSVLVAAPTGNETAPLITLRALRWIMDKRYGSAAKDRIYISAGTPRSALMKLGEALNCNILPMPESPGASVSALSPAALLIMAAAGISPGLVFSGASEAAAAYDDRSFDNPIWLYAASRLILKNSGLHSELLCTPTPASESLGTWWLRAMAAAGNKDGCGLFLNHAKLPTDFFNMGDAMLQPGHFATMLRLPLTKKKATVEVDWKDLDGLNCLAGQDLSFVEGKMLDAVAGAMTEQEVPFLVIECDEELTDDRVGELFCFLEMAAGLSAQAMGAAPAVRRHVTDVLTSLDRELGRK